MFTELNTKKNAFISLTADVKDLRVVEEKLSFLFLSVIAALAESQPVSIKESRVCQSETEIRPRPLKSGLQTNLGINLEYCNTNAHKESSDLPAVTPQFKPLPLIN